MEPDFGGRWSRIGHCSETRRREAPIILTGKRVAEPNPSDPSRRKYEPLRCRYLSRYRCRPLQCRRHRAGRLRSGRAPRASQDTGADRRCRFCSRAPAHLDRHTAALAPERTHTVAESFTLSAALTAEAGAPPTTGAAAEARPTAEAAAVDAIEHTVQRCPRTMTARRSRSAQGDAPDLNQIGGILHSGENRSSDEEAPYSHAFVGGVVASSTANLKSTGR